MTNSSIEQNSTNGGQETERGSLGKLDLTSKINGRVDTLRNTILTYVAQGQWELAVRELRLYQKNKNNVLAYKIRTSRHFDLIEQVITNIQSTLLQPGLNALPMAKRQAIYEQVERNFDSLKGILDRLDAVESDLKVKDIRASVWVLNTTTYSVAGALLLIASIEAITSLGTPLMVIVHDVSGFLMELIGF